MKQGQSQAWRSKAAAVGIKAVFSSRIHAQMVCHRIFSAQFFRIKTNVLCALNKLYSLERPFYGFSERF